ncbi:MAG: carbamoyltransferase family protein, partial [Terriglobales bacterium]
MGRGPEGRKEAVLVNVLGISCYYHDAAAALLCDGELVAAAEEERFSRRKHDSGFPARAMDFCLRRAGLGARDVDWVAFYEKPLVRFERILRSVVATAPRSSSVFREAMISWMGEKLWIKAQVVKELGISPEKILFVEHHASHAASAFFCSPFRDAAILTVDGVGEWTTATLGTGVADWDGSGENRLQVMSEMRFPHSLGLLYSTFTAFLGFEVNEGEYKVMGLAPYGQPRYLDKIHQLARVAQDGSLELELRYFAYPYSARRPFSQRFLDLFGPPREPDAEFFLPNPPHPSQALADRSSYYADVAASIQRFTEDALVRMATHLRRQTGMRALCMAGGVALNSLANSRILLEAGFDDVFVQPAAGDSGGSIGAALYTWHV